MKILNREENIEKYKAYLDGLDYDDLVRRIKEFKELTYSDYDDNRIACLFMETLVSNETIIHNVFEKIVPTRGWYFFRIRRTKGNLDPVESWFREPPVNSERPNRFDFLNQPIMYASFLNGVALIETKIKDGERYAEAVFTNNREIRLIAIGEKINDYYWDGKASTELSEDQSMKARVINEFEYNMMTMRGDDEVSAHRVAQIVARCIYNDADGYDGIMYPSVRCNSPYEYNVAFFNGKESLDLEYASIFRYPDSRCLLRMWFKDEIGLCGYWDQIEAESRMKRVCEFFKDANVVDANELKNLSI